MRRRPRRTPRRRRATRPADSRPRPSLALQRLALALGVGGWVLRWGIPHPRLTGELGEQEAARRLRRLGWRLVGRRVRTPLGEADLVAVDGEELVVIEVKTGRLPLDCTPRWLPGDRLRHGQQSRLDRTGRWLARRMGLARSRVLALEVLIARGRAPEVREFRPASFHSPSRRS